MVPQKKGTITNSVGIDLHKQTITVCLVDHARKVLLRKRLFCSHEDQIQEFFQNFGPFQAVVEATASYEWLLKIIEPLAQKVLLFLERSIPNRWLNRLLVSHRTRPRKKRISTS